MKENNILQNIGLCKRAGLIITGFDPVKKEMELPKCKISGILAASDLSEKSLKEIRFSANKYGKQVEQIPVTMDEIEKVLKKRAGILAILDDGLYKTFLNL